MTLTFHKCTYATGYDGVSGCVLLDVVAEWSILG